MMQKRYLIITGTCIILAAFVVGIVMLQHDDEIKPVTDNVPTITTKNSSSLSKTQSSSNTNSNISVTQASPANGTGQATGPSQGNTNSSSSPSQDTAMPDASTFSQYDTAQYQNGTYALFADLHVGTGTTLTAGHKAAVYYKGWLTNGQLFDETKTDAKGNPQPFVFTFNSNPEQVIRGWDEGLSGMKVGGVRMLIVPPAVGYGNTGQGPIPPNSVLIFQVQLVAVQ